jgi:hypothetical protein
MPSNQPTRKVYWPDGKLDTAPRDGEVWIGKADTYTWDSFFEAWVTGYGGRLVDFSPAGTTQQFAHHAIISVPPDPLSDGRVQKIELEPPQADKCCCGAAAVGSPKHSSWCDVGGLRP